MLKWLLFDLNSFFASCEQQEDPSLRGKPVAVVPSFADTTSVIAASYEAKKFGVKTLTKVGEAKKLCPGLILKTGNHKIYTYYHHKIVKAVEEVLPVKKVMSIDEMACELIGKEREWNNALRIAQQMKDHVKATVGSEIGSSVGVGPNILIAKIASDMQKPDGLVMVETHQILEKIGPLPIEALPGVGAKTKIRMNAKGYLTISDFMRAPEQELRKHWGSIWGLRVARELKGEDIAFNKSSGASYSHEHVLPPDLRTEEKSYQVLMKLVGKLGVRLREDKLKTCRLSVSARLLGGDKFEAGVSFNETDDTAFLLTELKRLYRLPAGKKPFKVTVVVSGLISGPSQMSFFDNPRRQSINQALDTINNRFGHNTLFLAGTKEVLSSAKTRISFNHIPELTDEFDET